MKPQFQAEPSWEGEHWTVSYVGVAVEPPCMVAGLTQAAAQAVSSNLEGHAAAHGVGVRSPRGWAERRPAKRRPARTPRTAVLGP